MSHKTILIIDDDQSLVALLKEDLESLGFGVVVAFDGIQGVLQAHQSKPDVILLDFHLPGGDGDLVYERLRQARDTAQTPIVFSTVAAAEEVKGRVRPSANTYFLSKPVSPGRVASAIRAILAEGKPAADAPLSSIPPSVAGKKFEMTVRVVYADTDKMGVVYYGNFFRYFEQGRTELLRSLGMRYRELETQRQLYLPVVGAACDYLTPARYDDLLIVRTWVCALGRASVTFAYEIVDAENPGRGLAKGRTRHALVNGQWKPTRAPDELRRAMEAFLGPGPRLKSEA